MTGPFMPTRRAFLATACCAAAVPLVTPVSFAAMPGENRLVTIVLRGAMDGLGMVQPYGDTGFAAYRPTIALTPETGLIDLDGHFGLHPDAKALLPLWQAGELSFVHAVSTPYRNSRSHFDGQDVLETGENGVGALKDGWLNRVLSVLPRSAAIRAIDVNTTSDLILSGAQPVDVWAPKTDLAVGADELAFFTALYAGDSLFAAALKEAETTDSSADEIRGQGPGERSVVETARLAGGLLARDYRIASFSIVGWDTHLRQTTAFAKPARDLAEALVMLKQTMGPAAWSKTVVVAMTEFGRTVRENGSGGTDHGTGGLALLAGGALRGGRILGRWPGLSEDALLDGRDLMPTGDVRALAAAMLHRQFDVAPSTLTNAIFPGLDYSMASAYL